jgi:predicted phosphodiesterase
MAPVALLYDTHGNLNALEAVLRDIEAAGASSYILGGDYALFGPWPAQTVERLKALPNATWIRGNGERWTAHPDEGPDDDVVQGAIASARAELGASVVAELAALPEQMVIAETRFCHGSPISDVRSFLPEPNDDEAELLNGAAERRIVFGHTHLPFERTRDGVQLVNPGSVGMPFDGDPRAAYALMHEDGAIERRRVGYEHGAAVGDMERFAAPWTETVARRIATSRF